jgi:hypothetical protein
MEWYWVQEKKGGLWQIWSSSELMMLYLIYNEFDIKMDFTTVQIPGFSIHHNA